MKKVIIYSTPSCHYCVMAKNYFKENDIKFEEIDIAQDSKKAEEMVKKTGQMAVPVIIIGYGDNEKIIIGFDKELIDKELEI